MWNDSRKLLFVSRSCIKGTLNFFKKHFSVCNILIALQTQVSERPPRESQLLRNFSESIFRSEIISTCVDFSFFLSNEKEERKTKKTVGITASGTDFEKLRNSCSDCRREFYAYWNKLISRISIKWSETWIVRVTVYMQISRAKNRHRVTGTLLTCVYVGR